MSRRFFSIGIMISILFFHFLNSETIGQNLILPYYDGFESYAEDKEFSGSAGEGIRGISRESCIVKIRDKYPARYGRKYLTIECEYGGSCSDRRSVYRGDTVFGGFQKGIDNHIMDVNNGNNYWIGWSNYIPANYEPEYFSHNFVQVIAPNRTKYMKWSPGEFISVGAKRYYGLQVYNATTKGKTGSKPPNHTIGIASDGGVTWEYYRSMRQLVWIMRYGGDSGERQQSIAGHHKFMDDARQSNKTFDATERWIDYRGEWIDWVLRVAWYDHDNPSAVFHLYMNGKLVYGKERDGLRNIATDRKPQWYPLQCYMPAYSTDYECVDSPSGGSNKIKNYNQPHTRATFMDEFRFGDSLSGIKDYCGVAPPIWPLPPKIDSLLKDAIGVKTSPTILYGKPENHREDRHNCFRRVATQVQVSLVGDDWSSLAYDSNNSGETAQQIIGLSENTKYQLRVRHKNKRSGSDEIYNGEWSETIFFTTGKADFGNAAKKIEQVKNFEAIFR